MNENGGEQAKPPKWKPIGRVERRVLGVLLEKAKTTPDAYPLTLNALTNGANQKSNRDPQMSLEPHQVETALESLRAMSAVMEISGGGRVAKFRHLLYEWMGVDKVEAAVMTELMLRGAQTLGELRGRAARMEPIADVSALQPIVRGLIDKQLIVELTPAGRGQIITHALYLPNEMDKIRAQFAGGAPSQPAAPSRTAAPANTAAAPSSPLDDNTRSDVEALRQEVDQLKQEVARLRNDVQDLWSNLS